MVEGPLSTGPTPSSFKDNYWLTKKFLKSIIYLRILEIEKWQKTFLD